MNGWLAYGGLTVALAASTVGVVALVAAPLLVLFVPAVSAALAFVVAAGSGAALLGAREATGANPRPIVAGLLLALAMALLQLLAFSPLGVLLGIQSAQIELILLVLQFLGCGIALSGFSKRPIPAVA